MVLHPLDHRRPSIIFRFGSILGAVGVRDCIIAFEHREPGIVADEGSISIFDQIEHLLHLQAVFCV